MQDESEDVVRSLQQKNFFVWIGNRKQVRNYVIIHLHVSVRTLIVGRSSLPTSCFISSHALFFHCMLIVTAINGSSHQL